MLFCFSLPRLGYVSHVQVLEESASAAALPEDKLDTAPSVIVVGVVVFSLRDLPIDALVAMASHRSRPPYCICLTAANREVDGSMGKMRKAVTIWTVFLSVLTGQALAYVLRWPAGRCAGLGYYLSNDRPGGPERGPWPE